MCAIDLNLDNMIAVCHQYGPLCPSHGEFSDNIYKAIGRMVAYAREWQEARIVLHRDGEILGIYKREDGSSFVMGAVYRGPRSTEDAGTGRKPEWTFHS